MTDSVAMKWARLQAAILSVAFTGVPAAAQDNPPHPPQDAQGQPPGAPGGPPGPQTLTPEQAARVGAILKAYRPASVTADDAKAIHRAFRDAGIRPGPGLHDAIVAAGFDPQKLRTLDPPPARPPGEQAAQGPGAPHP